MYVSKEKNRFFFKITTKFDFFTKFAPSYLSFLHTIMCSYYHMQYNGLVMLAILYVNWYMSAVLLCVRVCVSVKIQILLNKTKPLGLSSFKVFLIAFVCAKSIVLFSRLFVIRFTHRDVLNFQCDIWNKMSMPKLNDYELHEIIGSGSYSVVHRAIHKVS